MPAIQAAIEIARGSSAREDLRPTAPDELDAPGGYTIYFRGLAYLQLRQGDAAAAEFRRILDHVGLSGTGLWPRSPAWA